MKFILFALVCLLPVCVHAADESAAAFEVPETYELRSKDGKLATLRVIIASDDGLLVARSDGTQILVKWDYLDLDYIKQKYPKLYETVRPLKGEKSVAEDPFTSARIVAPAATGHDVFGDVTYGPPTIEGSPVSLELVKDYVRQTIARYKIAGSLKTPSKLPIGKGPWQMEFQYAADVLVRVKDSTERNVLKRTLQQAIQGAEMAAKDKAKIGSLPSLFGDVINASKEK